MKYKALISFSGAISMTLGETREISDEYIIKDLLNAGYISEEKENKIEKSKKMKGEKK